MLPPDVNRSDAEFAVADGKICFGLSAIKGCGGAAAEAIAAEREARGPFRSLFDFCERLDPSAVNRDGHRIADQGRGVRLARRPPRAATWRPSTGRCRRARPRPTAAAARRACSATTTTTLRRPAAVAHLPDVPEWDERDRLAKEKEVLGFYLSSHPLAEHAEDAGGVLLAHRRGGGRTGASHRSDARRHDLGHQARAREPRAGRPDRYAMFDLEDTEGIMRCIVWPEQFAQFGELVQPDAIVVVRGAIDKRPGSEEANLIVNEIIPRDQLAARYTRGVMIRVLEEEHGPQKLEQLHEILRGYPGSANCN